jgi:hypothetical protein
LEPLALRLPNVFQTPRRQPTPGASDAGGAGATPTPPASASAGACPLPRQSGCASCG